jgi:hypothetical protein
LGASTDLTRPWFDTPRGLAALWAGVLAGPFGWASDLLFSYSIVQWTCGGGPPVVLHLISASALLIIAAGAFIAWVALQRASDRAHEDGSNPEERGRFMAVLGLVMCAFFAVVVIATAVPRWVLDACQQ